MALRTVADVAVEQVTVGLVVNKVSLVKMKRERVTD